MFTDDAMQHFRQQLKWAIFKCSYLCIFELFSKSVPLLRWQQINIRSNFAAFFFLSLYHLATAPPLFSPRGQTRGRRQSEIIQSAISILDTGFGDYTFEQIFRNTTTEFHPS